MIIGAARQGLALARFLTAQGAQVTVNDQRSEQEMQPAIDQLQGYPVRWALGGHPTTLLEDATIVCVSGGVPLDLPLVANALQSGIPVTNDSEIFLELAPCPVIGITGSAGKTTTTTLLGRMAEAHMQPPNRAWVGGNIGNPLIEYIGEIQTNDLVILELSSFQLELMQHSPKIAAILNITPNHLDRHGTLQAYSAAKARILTGQNPSDVAVLNREDQGSWSLCDQVHGELVSFGLNRPDNHLNGTFIENGWICWQDNGNVEKLVPQNSILLRGEHNLLNVLAACALAKAANFNHQSILAGIDGFTGVSHRLEFIRKFKGADWYNDSIATAPERTSAALHSFSEPIVLLLGGRDKNLPWEDLAVQVRGQVDHVIVFGEASPKIMRALGTTNGQSRPFTIDCCEHLYEAVQRAADRVEPGDVVLLSPGGTSFDEFKDFSERGEAFRRWVQQLV